MAKDNSNQQGEVAQLLQRARAGDVQAGRELLPIVYGELHALAQARMAKEQGPSTLQPTALVHETWLRLVGTDLAFENRAHFFGAAAVAMRRVLIDHARNIRNTPRKAVRQRVGLETVDPGADSKLFDILAVDEALEKLERLDPKKATVVTLRFLMGCTIAETATAMGCSPAKVKLDWTFARAWLKRELEGYEEDFRA